MKSTTKKASIKKARTKKGKTNKEMYFLTSGPWVGQRAFLPPETMVFSVNGYHGQYIDGRWRYV